MASPEVDMNIEIQVPRISPLLTAAPITFLVYANGSLIDGASLDIVRLN
jgi:hypothetical protein